jgi:hypothetical protein
MEKPAKLLFILSVITAFIGCSTTVYNPVQMPVLTPDDPTVETYSTDPCNQTLLGQWVMNFDIRDKTVEIEPLREASTHYNLTSLLPPQITINSIDFVNETADVDITITNTFPVTGYDLRLIIYTDPSGHKLLNADDWTDLFDIAGGLPINPFIAYAKDRLQHVFLPGNVHTENFIIKLPGMNPSVKFAIEASYPTNCPEPYSIENFTREALFDTPTSCTTVGVDVLTWLGDITAVYLYCPDISGSNLTSLTEIDSRWTGTLQNTMDADIGDYPGYLIAYTTVSGSQALYDEVTFTVSKYGTPVAPVVTGILDTDNAQSIDVQGNYVYLADTNSGLKIIDVTDPSNPYVIGSLNNGFGFHDVQVYGNYVYAAAKNHFYGINVTVKDNPIVEYSHVVTGNGESVCVKFPYAYFCRSWSSAYIFNIGNPTSWIMLGFIEENTFLNSIYAQDNLLIISEGGNGIKLFDIADPAHPAFIKSVLTSVAYDTFIDGNYAYVADDGGGFRIVKDIYTPASAYIVKTIDYPDFFTPFNLDLQDDFLYTACLGYGIYIIDISIPDSACIFSVFETGESFNDIVIQDNYAYICQSTEGITIAKLWW